MRHLVIKLQQEKLKYQRGRWFTLCQPLFINLMPPWSPITRKLIIHTMVILHISNALLTSSRLVQIWRKHWISCRSWWNTTGRFAKYHSFFLYFRFALHSSPPCHTSQNDLIMIKRKLLLLQLYHAINKDFLIFLKHKLLWDIQIQSSSETGAQWIPIT